MNAPLLFVSASQINFQIPWETTPGTAVNVQVLRDGVESNLETITIAATASPSVFLSEFTNGVALITGIGCEHGGCVITPGTVYQLWANGLGPKNSPQQDGLPADFTGSLTPLELPEDRLAANSRFPASQPAWIIAAPLRG